SGTYELLEEKRDGGLTVRLEGKRLDGVWTLVPAKLSGDPRNWLLIRKSAPAFAAADYKPMLATLAGEVPAGEGWLHEVKWDGYRAICRLRGGKTTHTSRNGNDLTERFPTISRALGQATKSPDCVVDGEVCALDEHGRSSFSAMQQGTGSIVLFVFDLLE